MEKMNQNKNFKNLVIINQLKKETYTKKHSEYALLILDILEEANKFNKNLSNVYVNHIIIENILLDEYLYFFHDFFGRSINEFSPKFKNACNKLNKKFRSDYPEANLYCKKPFRKHYYTNKGFGTRVFIRKVILSITNQLNIEVVKQPIFISIQSEQNDCEKLFFGLYSGKRHGNYLYGDTLTVGRKFNKAELSKLQKEIETIINKNPCDFDETLDIIEEKIYSAA